MLISGISGGIATIVQMVISWSLYLLGIVNLNPSIFHARLMTNRMNVNSSEIVLGMIGNFVAGLVFAFLIIVLLKLTGTDYALLKGGIMGIINAMIQYYLLTRLFTHDPTILIPNTITIWHVYIVYCIWGLIVAYIATRYCSVKVSRHLDSR